MPADPLERIAAGRPVWPWLWPTLRKRDDPALLDALLNGLEALAPGECGQRLAMLEVFAAAAERLIGQRNLNEPPRPARLIAQLMREPAALNPFLPGETVAFEGLERYATILACVEAPPVEPLAAALTGPCAEPYLDAAAVPDVRLVSPRLMALDLALRTGDPLLAPPVAALAEDEAEPASIRDAAQLAATLLGRRLPARQALAQALLAMPSEQRHEAKPTRRSLCLAAYAGLGQSLVEPACACLAGRAGILSGRALDLLLRIGEPARETVRRYRAATRDFQTRAALDEVLRQLDRNRPTRRAGDRSLSRAGQPRAGPRGISRARRDDAAE